MKRIFTIFFLALCATLSANAAVEQADTTRHIVVDDVSIIASAPKQHFGLSKEPISSSVVNLSLLEREGITSVKQLSALMPNFYQPDYGSRMTSSIYVRGFGARIDQPVIGMMVDGVAYMNKNNYDFDMFDVARVELLRGPQSTLYGRNTMGGQMNIYTLSPMHYEGVRGTLEYGSGASGRVKASYYGRSKSGKFGVALSGYHSRVEDGFFDNAYDGSDVDWGSSSGGRLRLIGKMGRGWEIDNTASFGYSYEGGYAYMLYDAEKDVVNDVNYNGPGNYMRCNFSDGLVLSYKNDAIKFTSTTSYQYMHDRMRMDNDLTMLSYFNLTQEQREHAFTEDLVVRSNDMSRRWQWVTGAYGFYKKNKMYAPVYILEDGMKQLILGNMPAMLQNMLTFDRDVLAIESNFTLPTYGLALYHESSISAGERWRFTAGLRLDYEAARMEYNNFAELGYKMDMSSMRPGMLIEGKMNVPFQGEEKLDFLELLPKFAVNYTTGKGDLYLTATRGYKAGGFNTQIFSDILQSKLKNALMADAMSSMGRPSQPEDSPYDAASVTTYKPEYSWNYEFGGHLRFPEARVNLDFALFWIECRDQQLTVFPEGQTTGRMMSNAGASRSRGVELLAAWEATKNLSLSAAYGYTNAKFVEFNDGVNDYSGNYLPYAPQHTSSLMASYSIPVNAKWLDEIALNASWQGAGNIYWNEANGLEVGEEKKWVEFKQDFYSLLNASVELRKGDYSLSLWGKNLTNTDFYTFYFKSMNRNFVSKGKPVRFGATLNFAF
ncbi:MAG: TonB-dependent receptor [Alistipes sp.]|nr:TonB-dependent receptor [Alistipes sp.]